jgi:hypothetical protein
MAGWTRRLAGRIQGPLDASNDSLDASGHSLEASNDP